jgi:copper(I)-binding protein
VKTLITTLLLAAAAPFAFAQKAPVTAEGAWARANVAGQVASAAYMKLTARERTTLVGASTPAAGIVEIHEMRMEGEVMKMRALETLDLAAGQTVELKPGGKHVMLMDLKAPLKAGTKMPLTLTFRGADGKTATLELSVPVQAQPPGGAPAPHKH